MGARQSIDFGTTGNQDCDDASICQAIDQTAQGAAVCRLVCGMNDESEPGTVCRVIFEDPTKEACDTACQAAVCSIQAHDAELAAQAVMCAVATKDEAVTSSFSTNDEDLVNEGSSGLSKDDTYEEVANEMTELSPRSESMFRGGSDPEVCVEEVTSDAEALNVGEASLLSALEKLAEASARKHMEDISKFGPVAATLQMVSEMEEVEEENPVSLPHPAQVTRFCRPKRSRSASHQLSLLNIKRLKSFDEDSEIWCEVACLSESDEVPADKVSCDGQFTASCTTSRTASSTTSRTASRTASRIASWTDCQAAPTLEAPPSLHPPEPICQCKELKTCNGSSPPVSPDMLKIRRAAFACKVRILMATHLLGMCAVAVLVEVVCGRVPNILMRIMLWAASGAILLAVVIFLHRLLRTCAASTFHLLATTVCAGAFVGLSPGGPFSCEVTGIMTLASWLSATVHGTCSLRSAQVVTKTAKMGLILASWLLAFMLNTATVLYLEEQMPETLSVSIESESAVAAVSLGLTFLVHWDLETRMQCCDTGECLRPVVQVTIDTFSAAVVPLGSKLCDQRTAKKHQVSASCHDRVLPEAKAALSQGPTAQEIMAYFGLSPDVHESNNWASVSDNGEDRTFSDDDTIRV